MSGSKIFKRGFSLYRVVAGFALLTGIPTANALTQDINAIFRPDAAKPMENTFTNTTPASGYCAQFPAECTANRMFSIRLPIRFDSSGPIQPNHSNDRQGAMFKAPANWRTAQVINSSTGESEVVEIRVSGIGSRYELSDTAASLVGGGVSAITGHTMLWGSTWVYAPPPCTYSGVGAYGDSTYTFFWKTPQESVCAKQAQYLIPGMTLQYLDFAYELRTPNPLKMSTGHYMGTLNYTVGPGQDFDLGDVMIANDSVITLNFNLEVQHTLKVEIPPGGNRVVLEPQGGWQAWLNQGRKPTRLFRDQMFHISASSRFKMDLECQYAGGGNTCSLWDADTGHLVPVEISVTLPPGLTDGSGQSVNRRRLYRDGSGTELFEPSQYLDRKPGTLHFEIVRDQVEEMLQGEGVRTYTGNVTVIWDSEV